MDSSSEYMEEDYNYDDPSIHTNISTFSNNTPDVFKEEFLYFNDFWQKLLRIYTPLETAVMAFGLLGNFLALATLWRSAKMRTPSFIYHKALVTADFLVCLNYFLNLIVNRLSSVECDQYVFRHYFSAVFSGVINSAVNSICGYLIHYMTLIIALDRLIALWFVALYSRWNRRFVALTVVCIAVALATLVHSWSNFVQHTIITYRLHIDVHPLILNACWTDPVVYQWERRLNTTHAFQVALKIKSIFNSSFKMAYPILLALLTFGIIYGLLKVRKSRRAIRRNIDDMSPSNTELSQYHLVQKYTQGRKSRKANSKCENALSWLMVAVLLLAFLQASCTETKRILELFFPPLDVLQSKVRNGKLEMWERISNLRFLFYGHQCMRLWSNFCTAVNRSFICYLFVAMNRLFRRELLAMLKMWLSWLCCSCVQVLNRRETTCGLRQQKFQSNGVANEFCVLGGVKGGLIIRNSHMENDSHGYSPNSVSKV